MSAPDEDRGRDAAEASDLVRRHLAAYLARDWAALQTCYHPDARSVSIASGGRVLTVAELVDVLATAAATVVYKASYSRVEALDDRAFIISGRVRHAVPTGGFADSAFHWLWTLRDGLIYRSVVFASEQEARAAYAAHGLALGL